MSLIDRLINDPNSTFKAEDAEELSKLPPAVLKRMAVGLQPRAVVNEDSGRENDLLSDLQACQKDIVTLMETEKDIREELANEYNNDRPSVMDQVVAVMNQSAGDTSGELTEKQVIDYIQTSPSVTGRIMREALQTRDKGRKEAIEVIISNSENMFTPEELRRKFTPELMKMAEFIKRNRQTPPLEAAVLNYSGLGLADQSINQTTTYGGGGPLEIPSTEELPPVYR